MKKFIIPIILFSFLLLNSCDKYLDIKPKGYVIPQTVEDYERILNDIKLTKILSDGIEKLSDDFYSPVIVEGKDISAVNYRLYFWLEDPYSTPSDLTYYSYWNMLYNRIYQYNAIINGIDEAAGATQQRKDATKGRALIGRAICYYYLNNIYGQIPKSKEDQAALGIPLVISNALNEELPSRSSTWASFDFILNDLKQGIPLIPASSLSNFQINKAGAYGWLARVYLTMKEYGLAGEAAQEALKLNNKLLDYNSQYTKTFTGANDSIYLTKAGSTVTIPAQNPENLHVVHFDYTRGMAFQYLATSTLSAFDLKDIRRMNIIASNAFSSGAGEWDGRYVYMGAISYNYSIGPTTAEMYLILAESQARVQKYQDAIDNLNKLRKNRIESAYYRDLVHVDAKSTMLKIFRERRAELLFKSVRWFDMRRLQNDPEFGFTAEHELANGKVLKLTPNSPRYTMTIPASAINKQIIQNP